ncbi:MAG: hypothetical protein HFH41_05715 [Lachnospiraceae bacterium]|nr:hypothetical protein [Lachnospiraceae bacterium]
MFQRFECGTIKETEKGIEFYITNIRVTDWEKYLDGVYIYDGEDRILMSYRLSENEICATIGCTELEMIRKEMRFCIVLRFYIGNREYWCDVYHNKKNFRIFEKLGISLSGFDRTDWLLSRDEKQSRENEQLFYVTDIKKEGSGYNLQVLAQNQSIVLGNIAVAGKIRGEKNIKLLTEFQEYKDEMAFCINWAPLEWETNGDIFTDIYVCAVLEDGEKQYYRMAYDGQEMIFANQSIHGPWIEYFYATNKRELSVKGTSAVLLDLEKVEQVEENMEFFWKCQEMGDEIKKFSLENPNVPNEFFCKIDRKEKEGEVFLKMTIGSEAFNKCGFCGALYGLNAWLEEDGEITAYPVYLKNVCLKRNREPLFNTHKWFIVDSRIYMGVAAVNKSGRCMLDIQSEEFSSKIQRVVTIGGKILIEGKLRVKKGIGELQNIYLQGIYGEEINVHYKTQTELDGKLFYSIQIDADKVCVTEKNEFSVVFQYEKGKSELFSTAPRIINRKRATCYATEDVVRNNKYVASVKCFCDRNSLKVKVFQKPLIFITDFQNFYQEIHVTCICDEAAKGLNIERVVLKNIVTNEIEETKWSKKEEGLLISIDKRKLSKLDENNYLLQIYSNEGKEMNVFLGKGEREIQKNVKENGENIKLQGEKRGGVYVNREDCICVKIYKDNAVWMRWKVGVARYIAKVYQRFIKEPVWLVGENLAMIAQDNGYAFFQYCLKEKKRKRVYYVAQKENSDLKKLLEDRKFVIYYDSLKHLIMHFACEYYVVAHGIRDVMPSYFHKKIKENEKPIIYLQHGILGMKRIGFKGDYYNDTIKLFIVSSKQEKNICLRYMDFREEQIAVTGLARFDLLQDLSKKNETKEILLMPTWRDWIIMNRDIFRESSFYENYRKLLENQELHEKLRENNCQLVFYPHFEIRKRYLDLFEKFENDVVKIADPQKVTVAEFLRRANMLVTDYSSVVYEFARLKKPVCFFQFDKNEYLQKRGAYVSFEETLPGEILEDCQDVVTIIEEYVRKDFAPKEIYQKRLEKFFDYFDQKNCARTYESIMALKENG